MSDDAVFRQGGLRRDGLVSQLDRANGLIQSLHVVVALAGTCLPQ